MKKLRLSKLKYYDCRLYGNKSVKLCSFLPFKNSQIFLDQANQQSNTKTTIIISFLNQNTSKTAYKATKIILRQLSSLKRHDNVFSLSPQDNEHVLQIKFLNARPIEIASCTSYNRFIEIYF